VVSIAPRIKPINETTRHVSIPGVSGRDLLAAVSEVAASVESACHSETNAVSGVLAAMGCGPAGARGAVRLSVGFPLTAGEVSVAAASLVSTWRLMQRGGRNV
jgi:cysteine desulfurase